MEKLSIVTKSVLHSGDGFSFEITCYEDATEIIYFEMENGVKVAKTTATFTAGYDIQVFEAAIKLRNNSERIVL